MKVCMLCVALAAALPVVSGTADTLIERPAEAAGPRSEEGTASWYGEWHHGRLTASGAPFDMYGLTAAHRTMPLGSLARVTSLRSGKSVVVVVNDRGPYLPYRVIDLSFGAARELGIVQSGLEDVRIEVIEMSSYFPLEVSEVEASSVEVSSVRASGRSVSAISQVL